MAETGNTGDLIMDEHFTVAQIAKQAGLPETTVRRYLNLFKPFVRAQTFGRAKKYPGETIDLARSIAAMYEAGKETSEITAFLQENVPQIIEVGDEQEKALMTARDARSMAAMLEAQAGLLNAMRTEIEATRNQHKEESEAMLTEIKALRTQVEDLQKELRERPEQRQTLWERITGRGKKPTSL